MIGRDKIIGFSAHSLEEAERAGNSGADYISISPIFDTVNKDYFIKPLGVGEIGKIKEQINIPVIALGGINENNVNKVLKNGADGIAVMSAILLSDSPEQNKDLQRNGAKQGFAEHANAENTEKETEEFKNFKIGSLNLK